MDPLHTDTIIAPITGSGPAAVAVVRLSGTESFTIASKVFCPWPEQVRPRYALVGSYAFGEIGIALPFVRGASFTGEDVVELSVHGGRASVNALLDACIGAGARMARPGEFSLRAFMNGAIDLSEAEAIAEMVEAQTSRELRLANLNLSGGLRRSIHELIEELTQHLALIEATIDFSEEIGHYDYDLARGFFESIHSKLKNLLERGRLAHLSRQGIRVALLGRPNAGKSSLMNALLGTDRAIVTSTPGTTRDTIEESADWDGLRVVLIDTAGLRETNEQVEELGISRSLQAASGADELFYVFDADAGWTSADEDSLILIDRGVTLVGNKSDLRKPDRGVAVSASTGAGLSDLREFLVRKYSGEEDSVPVNDRQSVYIDAAREVIENAISAVLAESPIDLLGVLIQEAIDQLGHVVGRNVSESMLEEIFGRFCIGK